MRREVGRDIVACVVMYLATDEWRWLVAAWCVFWCAKLADSIARSPEVWGLKPGK
jgi:hypothetical protein